MKKIIVDMSADIPVHNMKSASRKAARQIEDSKVRHGPRTRFEFRGEILTEKLTREQLVFGVKAPENQEGGGFQGIVSWCDQPEQPHVIIDMTRARMIQADRWIGVYVLQIIWSAGWDIPFTPGMELFQEILQFARLLIEETKPEQSSELKNSFALAVTSAVTTVCSGGPSIRQHAACRVLPQASLQISIAEFSKDDGVVFGALKNLHQELAQYEYYFDDDAWDKVVLNLHLGLPQGVEVLTSNPGQHFQLRLWGQMSHPQSQTVLYNECYEAHESEKAFLNREGKWGVTVYVTQSFTEEFKDALAEAGWEPDEEFQPEHCGNTFSKKGDGFISFEEAAKLVTMFRDHQINKVSKGNLTISIV